MKKTQKTPTKPKLPKKSSGTAKNPPRAASKKRKKPGSSDALRAVILAGLLIAVAAFISVAVIIVHSTINKPASGKMSVIPGGELPEPLPVSSVPAQPATPPPAVKPAPASSVPAQPATPSAAKPAPASSVPARPATPPPVAKSAPASSVPAQPTTPPAVAKPAPAVSVPAARPAAPPERPPAHRGTLVFVIDDAGNNLRELEPFLRFPGPLTIAVLPGLPYSAEAARRIRAAGKEVFLHQPMEAVGGQAPGPGAIYSGMNADEIRAVLRRNVAEIGPISGMNNHQGSKITMDPQAMETVLAFCREQGLYFLDSRTIAETAAPAAARRLGMTIGERDVFLDNEQEKASMIRYIKEGLARAEQRGYAVMIGHTWSPALAPVLTELYPDLTGQGYSLNTASAHIREK